MDRVLLVFEDINEVAHIEATLRKVGFDVESIQNDVALSERLLGFNPDIITIYGKGHKFSTIQLGKKLKDNFRYQGKVVLIFAPNDPPDPQDLLKVRVDVLVQAPVGAIKLADSLLRLSGRDYVQALDKLTRIAETDLQFRAAENKILSGSGRSVDTELLHISGRRETSKKTFVTSDLSESQEIEVGVQGDVVADPDFVEAQKSLEDLVSEDLKSNVQSQIQLAKEHAELRLAGYKEYIDKIDFDIEKSDLKRTAARKKQKEMLKYWNKNELEKQDELRKKFVKELFKKK